MNTKTHDTRQHILDVGYQLIIAKGFTSVGLSQLLKTADVPKGSFYHYFKSKEHFGETLIEHYFQQYRERMNYLFESDGESGYDRLMRYFSRWLNIEDGTCNANKCLVVKLSAEVSDLSDSMRVALAKGANKIVDAIAQCIVAGIEDGSITLSSHELARSNKKSDSSHHDSDLNAFSQRIALEIYQQWLGASLLNKLFQDQHGLQQAMRSTQRLLKRN